MYIQWHQGISDKDNDFIRWNTTSVSHIRLAALGIEGPEMRKLAICLFKNFIEWRKTKPNYYMPPMGIEKMPSVAELEQDYFYMMTTTPDYSNIDSILEKYSKYKESHKIVESNTIPDICSIQ